MPISSLPPSSQTTRRCVRSVESQKAGRSDPSRDRLKHIAPLADLYYPEAVATVLVGNAPWVISRLYDIVKVVLSAELRSRIAFADAQGSGPATEKLIELANLPASVFSAKGQERWRTQCRQTAPAGTLEAIGLDSYSAELLGRCFPGNKLAGYLGLPAHDDSIPSPSLNHNPNPNPNPNPDPNSNPPARGRSTSPSARGG